MKNKQTKKLLKISHNRCVDELLLELKSGKYTQKAKIDVCHTFIYGKFPPDTDYIYSLYSYQMLICWFLSNEQMKKKKKEQNEQQ